jgi:4-carboxymuconolactone decarboxylase
LSRRETTLLQLAISVSLFETAAAFHRAVRDALDAGCSIGDVRELILHLSIYVGFPKALQSLQRLKSLDLSAYEISEGSLGPASDVPTFASPDYNFFLSPDIQEGLRRIDADFAELAIVNASALCRRPGLTAKERALITLASDVYHRAYEGPFQIHVEMVLRSGGTRAEIEEMLNGLSGRLAPDSLSTARERLGECANLNLVPLNVTNPR